MTWSPRRESARSRAAVKRRAVGEIFATSPMRWNRRWLFARDPFIPLNLAHCSPQCHSEVADAPEPLWRRRGPGPKNPLRGRSRDRPEQINSLRSRWLGRLQAEHQQELLIAAGSLDRRRNYSQACQAEAGAELLDLSDDAALRRRRPDDAATGDFPTAGLELRLDEDDGGGARRQERHDGRQHEPDGDEREIHGSKRDRPGHMPA